MSLQSSFTPTPEPGWHVCIACGRKDTTHPSMICNTCAAGSGSNTQYEPELGGCGIWANVSHNDFNGNDSVIEDIADAATR